MLEVIRQDASWQGASLVAEAWDDSLGQERMVCAQLAASTRFVVLGFEHLPELCLMRLCLSEPSCPAMNAS
jgi:hypothetical protein